MLSAVALVGLGTATALLLSAIPTAAQGVTTAAVSGCTTDEEGSPVGGLIVQVTNESTGNVSGAVTAPSCRYFISGLQPGGPYEIEVSGLGYEPQTQRVQRLVLGQNYNADFRVVQRAIMVEGIVAAVDPTISQLINPNRTGAEQLITDRQLATYPTISNNFTDAIQLSPHVGTGSGVTSIGQQQNRMNSIQIDGQIVQDLFGLGATGQPGGQAGARSITMSAVKEYQVLVAPFDVRVSGFTGGLINAVTKTGTNEWEGAATFSYKNQDFVRDKIRIGNADVKIGEFKNRLYGFNVGGPIIEDRAHIFAAVEIDDTERPSPGIAVGRESPQQTGINPADAERFAQLLQQKGVEPEAVGAWTVENPNRNVFVRGDVQLAQNHTLTVRNNWVHAENDNVQDRSATGTVYSFQSNGYFFETETNAIVGQLISNFENGMFNELTVGWTRIRDRRSPRTPYPVIQVTVPNPNGGTKSLRGGAEFFSQGNELDQDTYEITNNFSLNMGDHRVTVGVQDAHFKFRNLFAPGITGQWNFGSLDAFEAGTPTQFQSNVPAPGVTDLNARPEINQVGFYGQTEYLGIPNVVITAGLRYDVPIVTEKPMDNPAVTAAFPGRTTTEVASGNGILSPRLGINWDVNGDKSLQIRGGAGVFTGRFPYVWLSNVYSNTGLFTVSLNCSGDNVPAFTLDPNNQPDRCLTTGPGAVPVAAINLVDPDFEYPHAWRFDLAADKTLPFGIVGTAEFLYTRQSKQIFIRELNVDFDNPVSMTQGGRPVFGTHRPGVLAPTANNNVITTPSTACPQCGPKRFTNDFLQVAELTNSDQDRSWSFTLQGQKRYAQGVDFNASYTVGVAEDVSGLTSSIATSNIGFNPVKGSPNNPQRVSSDYETTHKIVVGGAWDVTSWFTWSVFYIGNSGDPYAYTYDGDVNADGYEAPNANNRNNDLVYVPTGPNDITLTDPADWTRINQFIEGESCLRAARGRIIDRNSCEGPWRNRVDTKFAFQVPTIGGQRAQLVVAVRNFLNLLNEDWGENRGSPFRTIELLELRGWDTENNRGVFRPAGGLRLNEDGSPNPFQVFDPDSRWQAQIGLRYAIGPGGGGVIDTE